MRVEDVRIINGDTAVNPYGWGVRGSRTTTIDGEATRLASVQAKNILFKGAAELLECDPNDLDARKGKIFVTSSPERQVTHSEAYMKIYEKEGSEAVYTASSYDSPSETPDPVTGYGNWSAAYAYGAKVAEVEVDTETGAFEVVRVISTNDVGTIVDPAGAQGQLDGGVLMGVGLRDDGGFRGRRRTAGERELARLQAADDPGFARTRSRTHRDGKSLGALWGERVGRDGAAWNVGGDRERYL